MTLNEAISISIKDRDYIVFKKSNKKVLYMGSNENTALSFDNIKNRILYPLTKHTITPEQHKEYLNRPSLYSF